ncbi:hypothetical protein C8R45DRAFT_368487 [Mycena sanguinolenta]|nr:hypothetical protein C8R45DRAFT_368487 [Mycena sanguinolenta]
MTTIHAPQPNMVPAIPSGALPQTPVDEWAENMTDLLAGHVTRTPVGTPGPDVPGSFPSYLEPDPAPVSNSADAGETKREGSSFLEDAQAMLAAATSYLPPGLASYLPSNTSQVTASPSESSLPPLPPSSSSVSASSGSTLPTSPPSITERLDSTATDTSAALSTTVHTGHSSSAIPPPSAIPNPPRPASGVIASHPGVAAGSFSSARSTTSVSSAPSTTQRDSATPQLVQSPASISASSLPPALGPPQPTEGLQPSHPGVDASRAAAPSSQTPPAAPQPTEGLKPSHPGVDASHAPASSSQGVAQTPPQPTEGLKPSHPGVDASRAGGDASAGGAGVHTLHLPTHIRHPHPHPTPVAVSSNADGDAASSILAASTPSLVPSAAGDSGYAASTESGTPALATPVDLAPPTHSTQEPTPVILPPMHIPPSAARAVADVVARAEAGDSPRLDSVPSPSASPLALPAPAHAGDERVLEPSPLSPLRRSDVVPPSARAATGDSGVEGDVDEPLPPHSHSPSQDDNAEDTVGEEAGEGGENEGGGEGGVKKSKKPKLLQRLKEKMHVGSSS